jgi:uncharacterized protein (DUF362 family)
MHNKSRVAVIACGSYNIDEVRLAVEKGMILLGGYEQFIRAGEKILVKPNMLVGDHPDKGTTTHPSVFRAVCEGLIRAGASVTWGDSPAVGSAGSAAKKNGIRAAADEMGIKLADFTEGSEVTFADGIQNKKFIIAKGVLDADGVVSLPRFKTHSLTRFTGCVKNQFGCVPGFLKGEFHLKMRDALTFSKMLVDLNNFVKPRLYIMDAVTAMEGNGPRGGRLRDMRLLLFSSDPIALDATACRLVNMSPEYVPTNIYGSETGSGTYNENEIEILGEILSEHVLMDFDIQRKPVKAYIKNGGMLAFINNSYVPKPVINEKLCIRCGVCVNACPVTPKAVDWPKNGSRKKNSGSEPEKIPPNSQNSGPVPVFNYKNCIRCYCCQELCPESAVTLKRSLLHKIIS